MSGASQTHPIRFTLDLGGIVQGVGMRPTLQRLATKAGLGGWVQNRAGQVRISLVGAQAEIETFLHSLPDLLPPHARIDFISQPIIEPSTGIHEAFHILPSGSTGNTPPGIPADLALCHECLTELMNPHDRRYGYPFTTCTQCGPRYSVVEGMPYDREKTTLKAFHLCDDCLLEYNNPQDRRFHAESMACPRCGPRLTLRDAQKNEYPGNPLQQTRSALAQGKIVAVRGMGGFLLVVDACNQDALHRLRQRKLRPHKPFAVMARNLALIRSRWSLSAEVAALLAGPQAPIVILDVPSGHSFLPMDLLAPDSATLGIMLPTTPLQWLLLEPLIGDATPAFDFLVMTSGNRRGEPICTGTAEAMEQLAGIAELFLCHDREIQRRVDDSLCVDDAGIPRVWRRARGYAPTPMTLGVTLTRSVLAMGAELKNTLAVGFADRVILSPHVGDLETPEAVTDLERVARQLVTFLGQEPQAIAVDLHPDMHSTLLGHRLAAEWGIPVMSVQHHHAHAMACMAEQRMDESLALVFDGAGLGTDGHVWGAEVLHVHPAGFERLATFAAAPLPGGDAAVRQPARQLVGRWMQADVRVENQWFHRLGITAMESAIWMQQCQQGINAPFSHAAGRLFDAFAAGLGMASAPLTYEGQAAVRLETLAHTWSPGGFRPTLPFSVRERGSLLEVDWKTTFEMLSDHMPTDDEAPAWAYAFHQAVALAAGQMIFFGMDKTSCRNIVLSGGVFMNRLLLRMLSSNLQNRGIHVMMHQQIPTNDGGISLGQAVIVGRRY
ncbi:MAG: carbamoyltransferase HypF [Magnetococcus sp. YQC-5]